MTNYLNTCNSYISIAELELDQKANKPLSWNQIFNIVSTMYTRSKQRQALKNLDQRLLNDIGLSREQSAEEANKPFWKA